MRETQNVWYETIEVVDLPQALKIDFDRIRVAPQVSNESVDFHTLSLEERQELLQRLINRVKTL